MVIDKKQLEINVNLYALQPDFLNDELHYVIAENENTFRFGSWNEQLKPGEQKLYFFLTQDKLHIPAGNITLEESYVLKEEPIYQCVSSFDDFLLAIEKVQRDGVAKAIKCFSEEDTEVIRERLEEKFGHIEKHLVKSTQGQHLLFVFNNIEISISATMVYFRHKTPFNDSHYKHVKEEKEGD
ncbi:MAG: hypothetical protein M3040_01540 [Bacteroidota bacterium]|nr:hypothetical protein [Bacteroidota bacterium]